MVFTDLVQASCFSLFAFVMSLFLSTVSLSHKYSHIVYLISFGAENTWFQLGAAAAAPAAGCDAHAALCRSLVVAVNALQPLQPVAV